MSAAEFTKSDGTAETGEPVKPVPGVADLGSFRGRTTRGGAPVLPPGWRPDAAPSKSPTTDATPRSNETVPVSRPPVAPVGRRTNGTAPSAAAGADARVVASRPAGPEVRVVRKIRPWSVWKLTLAFALCMVAVVATAGAILWAIAAGLGVLDNVEGFVEDLGFENFALDGGVMLQALVVGGAIFAVGASVMAAVLATMFNLLSDLTGGLEAETAPARTRSRRPSRRARRKAQRRQSRATHPAAVDGPTPVPQPVSPAADRVIPAAGVAVPTIDLTDEPSLGEPAPVDRLQIEIDDLLSDPPTAS